MAVTVPAWPTLKLGDSGKNVYALQYLLAARGIATKISGTFEAQTQASVTEFQTKNNILSDTKGVAGKGTLPKLVISVQQVKPPKGETIKATNSARAAQYLLSKFESLTIDGQFGGGAATALAKFQVRMRIPITGITDSMTWRYMFGYNTYPLGVVAPPSTSVYASVCAVSSTLTSTQMTKNAQYVCNFLKASGFSKAAACGVLGNMQQESGINPGIWEVLPNTSYGYGLVQWTPVSTKFFDWAGKNTSLSNTQPETINNWAVTDPEALMQNELKYLLWSIENESGAWKYSTTSDYDSIKIKQGITFANFKKDSTNTAAHLALVFHAYYERSNDDKSVLQQRERYATNWYNSLVW